MSDTEHFGRYADLRPQSEGGVTGRVYIAADTVRQEDVVLKRLPLDADPELLAAQRLGVALQERLGARCPQVPTVFDHDEVDGYFYVAMQLVRGQDLSSVLRAEGRVQVETALAWVRQLCEILQVSHELHEEIDGEQITAVVHSDIKLENLRLTPEGKVFLIDFGNAKGLSALRPAVENDYATPPNTPPEYQESGRKVDTATDLWAAGVVLYRLICGHSPFVEPPLTLGDAERDRQILEAIRLAQLRPVSVACAPEVKCILNRALAHSASRRYPSAAAFAADLDACLAQRPLAPETLEFGQRPIHEQTRRTVESLPTAAPSATSTSELSSIPHRWRGSRRLVWLTVAALVCLAGSQIYARVVADRAVEEISVEAEPDLDRAGQWLLTANWWSLLPLTPQKRRFHAFLLHEAESLFTDYREQRRTVRCSDWQDVQEHVDLAVRIFPDERATKARQLYVYGQLKRLMAKKDCKGGTAATYPEAVKLLEQAAEYDPGWSDPYLPLIDIYALREFNYERLISAWEGAQANGYQRTPQVTYLLAKGHQIHCLRLQRDARQSDHAASQLDYLESARAACEAAEELFREIPRDPNAAKELKRLDRALDEIAGEAELLAWSSEEATW